MIATLLALIVSFLSTAEVQPHVRSFEMNCVRVGDNMYTCSGH